MPNRVKAAKVRQLSSGPLPHLYSLKTYCDARPVFDSDGSQIESMVSIVTLSLVTHGGPNEHKEILVQLSQSDISAIRREFSRLNKKLKAMKARFPELPSDPKQD